MIESVCPECRLFVAVQDDGHFHEHMAYSFRERDFIDCPGSGLKAEEIA